MSDRLVKEELIKSAKDINEFLDIYQELLVDFEKKFLSSGETAEDIECDGEGYVIIYYGYWCCGEYCTESKRIPAEWYFLSDDELVHAKDAERLRIEEERRKEQEEIQKRNQLLREQRDREEYERLKAKFGD